jgi:cell division septum initiation protein DivIVA
MAARDVESWLGQAKRDAVALVGEAEAEAARLVAQAREEADRVRAELEDAKTRLDAEITRLRRLESDHRDHLRGHLTDLLQQVDGRDAGSSPSA